MDWGGTEGGWAKVQENMDFPYLLTEYTNPESKGSYIPTVRRAWGAEKSRSPGLPIELSLSPSDIVATGLHETAGHMSGMVGTRSAQTSLLPKLYNEIADAIMTPEEAAAAGIEKADYHTRPGEHFAQWKGFNEYNWMNQTDRLDFDAFKDAYRIYDPNKYKTVKDWPKYYNMYKTAPAAAALSTLPKLSELFQESNRTK